MMQPWFPEAKLGIFIHWGVYAVQKRGGESWPLVREKVSYDDYMSQLDDFTAEDCDPEAWADLIRRSGARYAVLTTKHHDGVALWPTREDGPSIPNDGRTGDLVGPFVEALRKRDLRTGLYFSHTDWSNLDHFETITGIPRDELLRMRSEPQAYPTMWKAPAGDYMDDPEHQAAWERFLAFHRGQIKELLTDYAPVDLLWFDVMLGSRHFDYRSRELRDVIHGLSPHTIVNSRLEEYGDYETPEQFIPVYPPDGPWEFCVTTNNSWSYTGREEQYKTPFEIVSMFCECLGMGGNMLLNIGPDEKGRIPGIQVKLLERLGDWIAKHGEAVYPTRSGLPHGYAYGPTSLNAAGDVLYLYLSHLPRENTFIKGIHNGVKRVSIVGPGTGCAHKRIGGAPWLNVPGVLAIDIPKDAVDELATVVKIELDGPLDLYHGKGVEIDAN